MSKRTAPPERLYDAHLNPHLAPEDETRRMIAELYAEQGGERAAAPTVAKPRDTDEEPKAASAHVPDVITKLLASASRDELLEIANMLEAASRLSHRIVFHTPVGDIKCQVSWLSQAPGILLRSEGMFFVKMRSEAMVFTPKPGAVFDIGFEGADGRLTVVCLAEPQRLYPGVDLLCFMPHNSPVEKNGKLKDDAPSVVSGAPSNEIVNGEPVVAGEKPVAAVWPDTAKDFDNVRS
jgi:hypothetical protein